MLVNYTNVKLQRLRVKTGVSFIVTAQLFGTALNSRTFILRINPSVTFTHMLPIWKSLTGVTTCLSSQGSSLSLTPSFIPSSISSPTPKHCQRKCSPPPAIPVASVAITYLNYFLAPWLLHSSGNLTIWTFQAEVRPHTFWTNAVNKSGHLPFSLHFWTSDCCYCAAFSIPWSQSLFYWRRRWCTKCHAWMLPPFFVMLNFIKNCQRKQGYKIPPGSNSDNLQWVLDTAHCNF